VPLQIEGRQYRHGGLNGGLNGGLRRIEAIHQGAGADQAEQQRDDQKTDGLV
jgi:hypothetical protein